MAFHVEQENLPFGRLSVFPCYAVILSPRRLNVPLSSTKLRILSIRKPRAFLTLPLQIVLSELFTALCSPACNTFLFTTKPVRYNCLVSLWRLMPEPSCVKASVCPSLRALSGAVRLFSSSARTVCTNSTEKPVTPASSTALAALTATRSCALALA